MYCEKCGTQLPDGAMFCTECGTPRGNIPPAPVEAAQVPTSVVPAANYAQPAASRKRPLGLIVTIVILSVLLIGGGFILLNRNSAPKTVTILGVKYDVATTTELKLNNSVISNDQLIEIAELTNLKELWLWDAQISDITPLANLTGLKQLMLGGTKISDITPLAKLTDLTYLNLGDNQISDITPLAELTDLTQLYLYQNQIRDITPLAKLTNLEELWLWDNQIGDSDIESLKSKLPNCNIKG